MEQTESGLYLPGMPEPAPTDQPRPTYEVDALPSEQEAIYRCILDERDSMQCHNEFSSVDDVASLQTAVRGFANRLTQRISEVGFVAVVSTDLMNPENFDLYEGMGETKVEWHPTVNIVARTSGKEPEADEEKRGYEIRHGLADGRVGRLKGGREWDDDPEGRVQIAI